MAFRTTTDTRMTLVLSSDISPRRPWRTSRGQESRVVLAREMAILEQAIAATDEFANVERVILDRSGTENELLRMLNRLPQSYRGDVLIVRSDWSYLSVCREDGTRRLQRLTPAGVECYLMQHALTIDHAASPVRTDARDSLHQSAA